jgi:hypothetical protein
VLLLAIVALSLWRQIWRPSRVVGLRLAASGELSCHFANGDQVFVRAPARLGCFQPVSGLARP